MLEGEVEGWNAGGEVMGEAAWKVGSGEEKSRLKMCREGRKRKSTGKIRGRVKVGGEVQVRGQEVRQMLDWMGAFVEIGVERFDQRPVVIGYTAIQVVVGMGADSPSAETMLEVHASYCLRFEVLVLVAVGMEDTDQTSHWDEVESWPVLDRL